MFESKFAALKMGMYTTGPGLFQWLHILHLILQVVGNNKVLGQKVRTVEKHYAPCIDDVYISLYDAAMQLIRIYIDPFILLILDYHTTLQALTDTTLAASIELTKSQGN